MTEQVSLEAFEQNLKNRRSVWIVTSSEFPPGFQDMILNEKPSYQRKVLLCSSKSSEVWKMLEKWDSIITITTNQDWSLALTHMLYQPKPTLVCITPELIVPYQAYQKLISNQRTYQVTIIQFAFLNGEFDRSFFAADCIIFPIVSLEKEIDYLYTIIQQTNYEQKQKQSKQVFKDILRDTRSASASILLSSINEQQGKYCMYWYYANLPEKSEKTETLVNVMKVLLSR